MDKNKKSRAPISQQSLKVEKPTDPTTIGGMISVELNEKKVSVPLGTTILEACKQNQIHIRLSGNKIHLLHL